MPNDRTIFTLSPTGLLSMHQPRTPENEDEIQRLIAEHPILVTGGDGELEEGALLVQREKRIADHDVDSDSGRWSIDHVYLTRDALPVLVEVKQASDTRLRRRVIGQLMEYAANAVLYWPEGSLRESFERRVEDEGGKPDEELAKFLGSQDFDGFWSKAESNLREGRLRLVVLADRIPAELATIIEFLNGQMRAEVLGIELQHYASADGTRTYVPRLIGQSEQVRRAKQGRVVSSELQARRNQLYEAAVEALDEFPENTGRSFLRGTTDAFGAEWVIFPKAQRLELEYIIRGKCSPEEKEQQRHIAETTGFGLAGNKVFQKCSYGRVEAEGIVAIFTAFREQIQEARRSMPSSA